MLCFTRPGRRCGRHRAGRRTGGTVLLSGLGGSLPSHLTLEELRLRDADGVWLTAKKIELVFREMQFAELAHFFANLFDIRDEIHARRSAPDDGTTYSE